MDRRVKFYETMAIPVFLFGCECRIPEKSNLYRMQKFSSWEELETTLEGITYEMKLHIRNCK